MMIFLSALLLYVGLFMLAREVNKRLDRIAEAIEAANTSQEDKTL